MKVKDLVKKLKEQDQEAPVVVYGCQFCMHGVDEVHEETHKPDQGESVVYVYLALQDGTGLPR